MQKLFLYFIVSGLTITHSYSQNNQIEKKLDELLTKQFKPTDPGCAILVAKQGKIIYQKAFGNANLELNVPLTPEMVFKLASVTKQFTAVAILQLAKDMTGEFISENGNVTKILVTQNGQFEWKKIK